MRAYGLPNKHSLKERDPINLADSTEHQLDEVRRCEVIELDRKILIESITACKEVKYFNPKIDLLGAEINKRQSRRNLLEKMEYEKIVWLNYLGFSNIQHQVVLWKTFRELETI